MEARDKALTTLKELNINYELTEHPAVYTIDEMKDLNLLEMGVVCKNLFLRDQKGKNHYLVVISPEKKADIKTIGLLLESGKLSFASEDRLNNILGIPKGAVSPLAVINNSDKSVTVVIDEDLRGEQRLGVHPNDNTATVWISFDELIKFISHNGNVIKCETFA